MDEYVFQNDSTLGSPNEFVLSSYQVSVGPSPFIECKILMLVSLGKLKLTQRSKI